MNSRLDPRCLSKFESLTRGHEIRQNVAYKDHEKRAFQKRRKKKRNKLTKEVTNITNAQTDER